MHGAGATLSIAFVGFWRLSALDRKLSYSFEGDDRSIRRPFWTCP
jgi:hypothetical protein